MLVDFKPIEEADSLLEECEQFVQQTKTVLFTLPFVPSFNRVRNWRSKRRDNKLMLMYENIQPRVVATEKILRKIIGEVVEKKTALRLQARHLHVRLESCIAHNKELLAASDGPLEELRAIVNQLSGESTALKDMITFNKEVLRIRNVEEISKGQNFVRWGAKPAAKKKNSVESDLKADADHAQIEAKLITIREVGDIHMYIISLHRIYVDAIWFVSVEGAICGLHGHLAGVARDADEQPRQQRSVARGRGVAHQERRYRRGSCPLIQQRRRHRSRHERFC